MLIFLPKEIDGLPSLEQKFPQLNFPEIMDGMRSCEVRVSLPKFKLENSFDLNDALQKVSVVIPNRRFVQTGSPVSYSLLDSDWNEHVIRSIESRLYRDSRAY